MKSKSRNGTSIHKSEPLTCKACPTKELHIGNVTERLIESPQLVKHFPPKHRGMGQEAEETGAEERRECANTRCLEGIQEAPLGIHKIAVAVDDVRTGGLPAV